MTTNQGQAQAHAFGSFAASLLARACGGEKHERATERGPSTCTSPPTRRHRTQPPHKSVFSTTLAIPRLRTTTALSPRAPPRSPPPRLLALWNARLPQTPAGRSLAATQRPGSSTLRLPPTSSRAVKKGGRRHALGGTFAPGTWGTPTGHTTRMIGDGGGGGRSLGSIRTRVEHWVIENTDVNSRETSIQNHLMCLVPGCRSLAITSRLYGGRSS